MGRAEVLYERLRDEGEAAIDRFILERKSEELFLDFKRSASGENKLADSDLKNLSKAISGFGNSAGGVILWGVDSRTSGKEGVGPNSKISVRNPRGFAALLEDAVSKATRPAHQGVLNLSIESNGNGGWGYVATLVPEHLGSPLQCIQSTGLPFYIRAGSSFHPAPYEVLAAMFGRKPQAAISYRWELRTPTTPSAVAGKPNACVFRIRFVALNEGRGAARNVFANFELRLPNEQCRVAFIIPSKNNWFESTIDKSDYYVVSEDSFILSPGVGTILAGVEIVLVPPYDSGLDFVFNYGCAGIPPQRVSRTLGGGEVGDAVRRFQRGNRARILESIQYLLGLDESARLSN